MPGFNDGFLDLPQRPGKPRGEGLTHVIDKGLNLREIEGMFDTGGQFVDIVKLGWGTSYVTNNLEKKIALYRSFETPVVCGGTLSEVGSKDPDVVYAPYQWVEWIKEELDAGAVKVITEAREGGTAGIFRKDGDMRTGLLEEIAHEISINDLIFEAPTKSSQAWFVKNFGPNVNLGNIPPDEVIPLETLRLGLRGDTLKEILLGDAEPATP